MRHDDVQELHKSYLRVFSTPDGMRVLKDLKSRGHVETSTFSTETGRMQFNEGRRAMVLHVQHMMNPVNFNDSGKEKSNG